MKMLRLTIVLAAAIPLFAQPDVTLQRAIRKESVEGDLKGAIELYRKAAAEAGKDRTTGAQALLHLAQCYEKQGNAEAKAIYERVLREYPDQKEASAAARLHLGNQERALGSTTITTRQVWAGRDVDFQGSISPDGRFLTYSEGGAGNLFVHEIATGANRQLTKTTDPVREYALESVISRDGKRVAFSWAHEIRTAELNGDANPTALLADQDISWAGPYDWSPDGQSLAVQVQRKDRTTQIGLVSTRTGSLRILKSIEWRGATKVLFSPDGKYVAFDLPSTENAGAKRDVFVLAVDGSVEIPAVVQPSDDRIAGWSPDGSQLLFSSDRGGTVGLWRSAFQDGKRFGSPLMIKPDIGRLRPMGVTSSGALYYGVASAGISQIQVLSFDFATGQILGGPDSPIQELVGAHHTPDWSPDGKYLSYVRRPDRNSSRDSGFVIHHLATGEVREIHPALTSFVWPRWAPDSRSLTVTGIDLKGRRGVYRVDAQSGEVSVLVPEGGLFRVQWSPDGKKLYYAKGGYVERDMASGDERIVIQQGGCRGWPEVSPDARYVACGMEDPSTKEFLVRLFPVAGGEPRELFRAKRIAPIMNWLPDSRGVVVAVGPAGPEFWLLPVDEGKPRNLGNPFGSAITSMRPGRFQIHPDGRQIVFMRGGLGGGSAEVWMIENFLPNTYRR